MNPDPATQQVPFRKNKLKFRVKARLKSVEVAIQLRPMLKYDDTSGKYIEPQFDILTQASIIYNWLTQDL